MLNRYLPLTAFVLVALSCSKGSLETKPSIEIKDINATSLRDDQDFLITLNYRDREGDLGNGLLTYIRQRQNVLPVVNDLADTVRYQIPDFPKESKGEIQVRINAGFLNERPANPPDIVSDINNDTVNFRIFVTDVAGNSSDTISTGPLVQLDF